MAFPFILYSNIYETGTISATSEAEAVENVIDWRSYVRWQATSTATQYLTVDYGSATACDSLGIAGHNLSGATISVASSTTGAWAGEQVTRLTGFTPSDNSDICKPFTSASVRYWRIKILTPTVAPEVGVLCLGAKLEFPSGIKSPMEFLTESMETTESTSKGGHLLGAVNRYRPFTFTANFIHPSLAWLIANFDLFWTNHGSLHKPFFFSVDSDEFTSGRFVRFPVAFKYKRPMQNWDYLDVLALSFEGVL